MSPFTCPRCGITSHHPRDAIEGYCARCHEWTGDLPEPITARLLDADSRTISEFPIRKVEPVLLSPGVQRLTDVYRFLEGEAPHPEILAVHYHLEAYLGAEDGGPLAIYRRDPLW